MKQILLLAMSLAALLALPSLADENDALRSCLAFQMATGVYRSADPQAPYRLLDACAVQWQAARLRVMREKNIDAQTPITTWR
jgi:hypothetical protein